MKRQRISSSGRLPRPRKVWPLEWLLAHEAAAIVVRIKTDAAPADYERRLLLTVSIRQCQRAVEDFLRFYPARRYYP